jgi:competence ComEA-like helix-hairpin-helix protein
MKKGGIIFISLFIIIQLQAIYANCSEGQININTASKEELDKITQIGLARAEQIIQSRPFNSIEDLIDISGIGNITLSKIKEEGLACVEEENSVQDNIIKGNEEKAKVEGKDSKEIPNLNESVKTITSEVIKLNPKDIKTENSLENLDTSKYAVCGLVIFCIVLMVLFVLKNRKYKNEFR